MEKTKADDYMRGSTIKMTRVLLGLTQRQLAKLAGLSHATISQVENENLTLSTNVLARILTVFVSLGYEKDELMQVANLVTSTEDKRGE